MRKNLYCSLIALLSATLLFLLFKPRLMDVFEFHQVETGYSTFICMFVLDVILCFFITRTFGNFLEAFFTSQSRTVIFNRLVYVLCVSFGFVIDLILRFAHSVPNWVKLNGDGATTFLLLSMFIALFIAFLLSLFVGLFLDEDDYWFQRWFTDKEEVPKTNISTDAEITKETAEEVITTTESLHNLQLIQSRLQKATELYHTLQTDEGREEAKGIIDDMQQEIDRFNEELKQGDDKGVLTEIKMQKRMNDALIRSNPSSPIK